MFLSKITCPTFILHLQVLSELRSKACNHFNGDNIWFRTPILIIYFYVWNYNWVHSHALNWFHEVS